MQENTTIKPLKRLLYAQGDKCFFCREPLPDAQASVEHLVATANGGPDNDGNCVACCKSLNNMLGSMSLKEKINVVLNQKGQFKCPNGVQSKVKKVVPQAPKKPVKLPESYAKVVADLGRRGKAKPRTVPKLKNTIASLFQKKISKNDVDALVQQLKDGRVISIAGSKVTYP